MIIICYCAAANMKAFNCVFWAALYCVLYLVSASDDDLMDFDFSDLKEIDWNYDNDNDNDNDNTNANANANANAKAPITAGERVGNKLHDNVVTFDDELVEGEERNPFDWREHLLRNALARALTNRALRQKFIEVMPILRVLSSQQRLALSAIISAQINAKKGHELRLDQVRMMFGDDKKLILPLVYDIANMVRNSARQYLDDEYNFVQPAALRQTPIEKRKFDLTDVEDLDDDSDVGVVNLAHKRADSLEDFMGDVPDDVIDPKEINAELQPTMATRVRAAKAQNVTTLNDQPKRSRRSTQFVHKLIRSIPLSVNEDDSVNGAVGRTMQLNTTSFERPNAEQRLYAPATPMQQPTTSAAPLTIVTPESSGDGNSTASYQQIEDLAFANLNGTAVDLTADGAENRELNEPLPNPEELISGPRYRVYGNKLRQAQRPKYASKRKRVQSRPRNGPKVPPPAASSPVVAVAPKKCERFTASMCLRTEDYPLEQIMGSIRRHKNAMSALLAEFHDSAHGLDFSDEFDDFQYNSNSNHNHNNNNNKRRDDDGNSGGGMCQSLVRFARPQKARSASGEWKYIVNTGQHTQTLRLEKCTNPQESCSYLAQSYRSHCAQVYNYHRLLSWDKSRGLHVDIFKVPTCCSCQVDGYRQQFPPLDGAKAKDFTSAHNVDVYSTINEELDYNDEEDEDDLSYQYSNGFGQHRQGAAPYDENELLLGSNKVRTKVYPPSATVGSYLSPPGGGGGGEGDFEPSFAYKAPQRGGGGGATAKPTHSYHAQRRRPYKSLGNAVGNEARLDLDIAPSETHVDKEVNLLDSSGNSKSFAAADKTRAHQKRKRVFSVPHTATSGGTTTATHITSGGSSGIPHNDVGGGGGGGITSSTTSYAHQAPSAAVGNGVRGGGGSGGGFQPKARFRSTSTFTTDRGVGLGVGASVPPPTTEESGGSYRPAHKSSSSVVPPSLYHVNSVFSAKYNSSNTGLGTKRINYSYHPIIDFFDNNKRTSTPYLSTPSATSAEMEVDADDDEDAAGADVEVDVTLSPSPSPTVATREHVIYPYKIARTRYRDSTDIRHSYSTRERRIGFGAGAGADGGGGVIGDGGGGGGGGGIGIGGSVSTDDSAWHPMITM